MLAQKEIKQIELVSIKLKKWADNLSYKLPYPTKVTLTPSSRWRYKKEILLLCAKTKMGDKVENAFTELDQLHKEYESWRAKTLTENNEEKFRTLVDCLKGTCYDLADTFQQIAQIYREELSFETPAETERNATPAKPEGESWLWKLYEKTLKVIVDAVLGKVWHP